MEFGRNYGKCTFTPCTQDAHPGSYKCIKHCAVKNHYHCINEDCDEQEGIHDSDRCYSHCKELWHGHCIFWGCSSEYVYCNLCEEHASLVE